MTNEDKEKLARYIEQTTVKITLPMPYVLHLITKFATAEPDTPEGMICCELLDSLKTFFKESKTYDVPLRKDPETAKAMEQTLIQIERETQHKKEETKYLYKIRWREDIDKPLTDNELQAISEMRGEKRSSKKTAGPVIKTVQGRPTKIHKDERVIQPMRKVSFFGKEFDQ